MLTVVVWFWREGYRDYRAEQVNIQRKTFARNLKVPHRFVCITDETEGFDPEVVLVRTPAAAAAVGKLRSLEGKRFPSCFQRLWLWSEEAQAIGDQFLLTDLDAVPVRDLTHLVQRTETFVGWRPRMTWGVEKRVAGGLYLLKAGAHADVWSDFQGQRSIAEARAAGFRGSDQAWISYRMAARAAVWAPHEGVYSIRDLQDGRIPLPADACIVNFNGPRKPWDSELPWVIEAWR